jgi:hypothetical protein
MNNTSKLKVIQKIPACPALWNTPRYNISNNLDHFNYYI